MITYGQNEKIRIGNYEFSTSDLVNYIKHRTNGEGYMMVSKDKMEIEGNVIWKTEVPANDNTNAGFAISITAPTTTGQEFPLWDTDGYSGLKDGKIIFSGWNDSTGWKSQWACSIESLVKCFATRVKDGESIQIPEVPQIKSELN